MATVIGTVTKVVGMAIVVDEQGNRHMLKEGEALHAGDKVVTASGATVVVKLANGETVNFAEAQTVKITENLAQADVSDVTENSVNQAIFDAVLTALNEGRDVTEVLDDPAAGAPGSDGNASFVNLDRIQTADANASNYNGGNGSGTSATLGGIAPNYVYFAEASGAPGVVLLGDADNNGILSKSEVPNNTTIARISLPVGVEPGDTVNIAHNTGTVAVTLTAANIATGFVDVNIPVPNSLEGTTLVVTASVTNQAGQTSPSGSDSALIDTTPPDVTKISGQLPETVVDDTGASQTDNITKNPAPTLIGTTENVTDKVVVTVDGKDYTATVSAGPNGTAVWTVPLTGASLTSGTYTPKITVTDLAGNVSTKDSETFTVDVKAPEVTITLDSNVAGDGVVNLVESQSAGIPVTGKVTGEFKAGDVVTITVNNKDFTGTVTAAGTFSINVPGADLAVDANRTIDARITVTDTAGNSTTATDTQTYSVDTTPPDLTKISGQLPETVVDDTGASQTDNITKNPAPTLIGTTENVTDKVVVTVDGKDYTATVSAGPNGTAVWTVPLTGASLTSGTYTPKITVTDLAGNVSTKDSETFTVDVKAPEVTITLDSNVAGDGVVNLVESQSAGIPVTGKVTGEFKAGDVVTITVNNNDFTGTVTAAGTFSINVPGADLAADANRTIDARITVTDTAGNSSTATDSQTYGVDVDPPALAISLDANVAGDGIVNVAESTAAAIPVTGTVSGQFKVGDIVTLSINNKTFTGAVLAGGKFSIDVPGPDLAADADRTIEASVTTTDVAGNSTTATDTQTYTVNLLPPALAISLDANVAGDGIVNVAESTAAAIPVTGTVSGQFKAGDIVTVTVNGKDFTGAVATDGTFSINVPGADLAKDPDATVFASVTTTNAAGNSATATDTQTYTVNLLPPALAISLDANVAGDGIVNVAESTAASIPVTGTVSGQFKVGDIVTLTINNKPFTGTVLDGGKFSINVPGADLAADSDATIFASVTTTNAAGNSATATDTQTYTVNTAPPAVAISLDANVAGDGIVNVAESTAAAIPVTGTVSGQFKAGDIVTVTVNGKDFTGAVATDGTFSINVPGADLAKDPDATVFASVTTTNAAGNSATATDTQTYTVNLLPPALAISLDANVAGDGIVNVAESTAASIPVTGTVSGQFKVGDIVTLTINNKPFTGTVLDGGKFSINVPGADLAADSDATIFASVTTTNAAGNSATATDTQTYTVNTAPPAVAISLDANVAGDGIVNVAESTAAAIPVTGTVSGQFKAGDIVTVTVNGKDFTGAVATDGTFSINVPGADLAKDPDATVFASVTTTNAAGNSATATDTQTYTVNLLPPALAISLDANVAGDGIVNVAESTAASIPVTGTVSGQFKVGDIVTLTINNKPFTGTVLDGGKFSINVPGADLAADSDATIFASVTTTNAAGNSATATDTQDYKLAINPNLFATIALDANFAGDGIINIEEAKATTTIAVTGTVGGDAEVGDPVVVTINGKDYATTVVVRADGKLGFSVNVAGNELAADPDKTIDAKVTVSDNAGNSLSQSTQLTYTVDLTPPKAEIALDANFGGDGIINIEEAKATSVTPVTGTVGGDAKLGDPVVVTINGKDYATTVVTRADGKLGFSVNVAGNELAADADKTIDAKVTVTDNAGNTASQSTQLTYSLDLVPPKAEIALDANFGGDGIINIEEAKATSVTPVTGTVGGDAKLGDPVVVTINGKDYATTVVTRADGKLGFSVNVAGNELAADADKTIDAKVTVTDNAGNTASQSTQLTYSLDLVPPKAEIALDANFGGDGIINIEEAKATSVTPVTGTVGGDAKLGDPVVVTINGKDYATTVVTRADGKLGFSVNVAGNELAADADKTIDAKVTVTDNAGNTASQSTQLTYSLDLVPPKAEIALDANFGGDGIINIEEAKATSVTPVTGTVGGDAKLGDPVVVTINGKDYATTVVTRADGKLGFSVNVAGNELAADADKTIDAKVTVTDNAGNTASQSTQLTYSLDLVPPKAEIALDANFGGDGIINIEEAKATSVTPVTGTVGGDAKLGDPVVVTINGKDYATTVVTRADGKLGFSVNVAGNELAADADKTIDAKVTVTDNAGNTASQSTQLTYSLDLTPPIATIALDANFGGDGIINIAESQPGVNQPVTGTVGGEAKLGDPVIVTINGKEYATTVVTRADGKLGFSVSVPGSELVADNDKTIDAKVTTTDTSGNVGVATTQLTYVVDVTAPIKPTIDNIYDDFGTATGNVAPGGVADDATPTLSGKAEAGSTVTIFDGTTKVGTAVADKDGKWTFTPATDINKGLHNYTVTATDNAGNTSVPSDNYAYTLNQSPIFTTLNGTVEVSEDGLPGGLIDAGPSNIIASGSLGISDPNGDLQSVTLTAPTTNYTSGGVAITWTGNNTGTLIGSANGKEVIRVTIEQDGDYAVRLSGPIDHPAAGEDTLALKFGVNAKDTDTTTTGSITVNVSDDAPTATNQTVTATGAAGTNIMLTLDVSGSMATRDGVNGTSRLDSVVASINTLLNQYANLGGDVRVMIVTFSDGSSQKTSTWVTIAEAKQVLSNLSAVGGTNYDSALDGSKSAFNSNGKVSGGQNVGYFFSDGEPNSGRETGDADRQAWEAFLKANDINEYALGVGSGVSATQVANSMNQIAYNGATEVDTNAIQVTNFAQLDAALSQTVPKSIAGSLTDGGGFGADGGYVKSLVIEGTTYTFDAKTGAVTVTGTNNSTYNTSTHELSVKTASGSFVVDMDNGKYTFTPGQTKVTLIDTTFDANGSSQQTPVPLGWFTDNASGKIEIMPSTIYGLSASYGNVLEIENFKGDGNLYTFINPGKNETVTLSFDYAARSGYTSGTDSAIQVIVDGKVIDTVNTKNLTMSNFSYTFSGTGSQMRVEFKSVDTNSTGGLLDNIKITTSSTIQPADSTKVTYTLSDNDGDTSTADLTLNVAKNNTYTPTPAVAPEVGNGVGAVGLLTLPGLLNVDLLNFSSRQAFTASDVNNNINNVTISYSTLLGITLGSAYMTYSQAVANELGLTVNYSQNGGFLGLLGASGKMVITAADGGTVDNLALNEFLSTVRVNEQLVDVSLLQSFTITATDSTNLQDSATSANLINIDLLSSGRNSNVITGGDAGDNVLTGTSGNDIIYGYAGNDTLNGGSGNDILRGGAGNDTLNGGDGNDILIGGKGNDTLTGGAGVDVFKWDSGDEGVAGNPARDTITDFNKATVAQGGDVLDIRDLLQGENPNNLQNYMHFERSGSDTIVHISSNGGFANDAHNVSGSFSSGNTTQQIVLSGVDLTSGQSSDAAIINNLLSQQKLVVDQ